MKYQLSSYKLLIVYGIIITILYIGLKIEIFEKTKDTTSDTIFKRFISIIEPKQQQQQQPNLDFSFFNKRNIQQNSNSNQNKKDKRILFKNEIIDTNSRTTLKHTTTVNNNNNNNNVDVGGYFSTFVSRLLKSNNDVLPYNTNGDEQNNNNNYGTLKNHYIVQFKDHINDDTRRELNEFLISTDEFTKEQPYPSHIIHYIPQDSFLVLMTEYQSKSLSNKEWISWIGLHEPSNKLHLNYHAKSIGYPVYIIVAGSTNSMVNNWETTLNSMLTSFQSQVSIQSINSKKLKVVVSCKSTQPSCSLIRSEKIVYQWISEQSESNYIERSEKFVSANRLSPTVIFGTSTGLSANNRIDIPLRGKGQIISISDTGLDTSHCFFTDSSREIPFNTIDKEHRKVVTYIKFKDGDDYVDGHGTHVCGSAVGSPENSAWAIGEFSGLASEAKLAFFDLSVDNAEPTPPEDYSLLYQPLYDAGARVHGDSWGSVSLQGYNGGYSDDAAGIDAFLYTHPEFTILRAAGNYEQYSSLLAQATSKNAITIGAEQTAYKNYQTDAMEYFNFNDLINLDEACAFNSKYCAYTTAQCCAEVSSVRGLSSCCPASMKQSSLTAINGNPQLFNENNVCDFSSKGPTHDGRMKPDLVAPGEYITSARSNGPNPASQCGTGALPNTDGLMAISGTSMATPLATAATTILRQYLVEGYYPTGSPIESNSIIPTNSLIKALMINNAQFLNGTFRWTATNTNPPNNVQDTFTGANVIQGWGALRMNNWLNVNKVPSRWIGIGGLENGKSHLDWKEDSLSTGLNKSYCFKYTPKGNQQVKIVATLVWTDPPSFSGAKLNLVNNLDLQLLDGLTGELISIGNSGGSSKVGIVEAADIVNNVEGIIYTPSKEQTLKFTISGTNIPIGPQNFSFVFHGEGADGSAIVEGQLDWADECPQCVSGVIYPCLIANGIGIQSCGDDLLWSACLVQSCNSGYNYNSLSKTCDKFLSYNYIIIIVAGGTMVLIIILLLTIKYLEYKESKKDSFRRFDDGTGIFVRPKDKDAKVSLADLYNLVSPFIIELAIATACSLVATAASILQPFYIGNIIQEIPSTKHIGDFQEDFIIIFVLAFVEFLFTNVGSWISGIVNEKMIMRMQNKVFRALIAQDMGFFQRNNSALLMNVLIVDTPMLRSALTGILITIATGICKLIGSLVFIFTISWKLSLAFFAAVPILGLVTQIQSKFTKRLTRQLLFHSSKASQHGTESMTNMHVVTNYCKQDKEIIKYSDQLQNVFTTARRLIITNTFAGTGKWLLIESLTFVILYFSAYLVIQKQFTVGLMISFSLYIGYVIDASSSLFGVYVSYVQSLASATRVFMILRSAPRKRTTLEEEEIDRLAGLIDENGNDKSNSIITSSNDNNNNNDDDKGDTGGVGMDSINNNNNNNNNNKTINDIEQIDGDLSTVADSTTALTKKELKKQKEKEQKEYFKRTGISVGETPSLLPSSYIELSDVRGDIEFKNVSFSYPTRPDVQVLHNINMKFEEGKCYGLVGPSGSGKSTALELISKFYALHSSGGKILLDDEDISKIRPSNLRSFVTCVHQHPYLFDATIGANIGYAMDNPTLEDIQDAAKLANAHEFIMDLPKQYDTEIGEAGNLSGGQKKRIAVARAICAKRKIMLLDEITAELDPESEEAITNSIKKLTQGHTVVMVAHKVAAVRDCDKIFVLEKGYLIEEGTHDQLMNKRGKYFRMFSDDKDDDIPLPLSNSNSDGSPSSSSGQQRSTPIVGDNDIPQQPIEQPPPQPIIDDSIVQQPPQQEIDQQQQVEQPQPSIIDNVPQQQVEQPQQPPQEEQQTEQPQQLPIDDSNNSQDGQ